MTASRFGTSGRESAPVDERMRFSSMAIPGRLMTADPVAMTTDFASITCFSPLMNVTSTLPGPMMRPVPWKWSILFFFRR